MTFNKPAAGSLEMRTVCNICKWDGEWVRTPGETLSTFASHLLENHPNVLRDPVLLRSSRKDEFRYVKKEGD